ncbi:glycosyltransferase [Brevundimonas diminuta]|uniref:glycosyltransferase n=1 Tax=Brevundimonas diminuta TaxID=293 RepID=UPI002097B0CC|nr:glycosyltransferase [Brevundimonas diminuta]MCO8017965.1 glycosyltransferase [Brevundimonas diminuta]MCO8022510.1 glycosyltransferase [Brevundimonas diminuta]
MKIATVTHTASRLAGGLFNSVRGLNQSLTARGHQVCVFAGRDSYSSQDIQQWAEVDVALQDVVGPPGFGFQPALLRGLKKFDPDIIHQHGIWTYSSLAALRYSNGRSMRLISPRGSLDRWALRRSRAKKWIASLAYENKNIRSATALHALCESELRAFRELGYRGPVAVVPNGTDSVDHLRDYFKPEWRKNIAADAHILLFLGRLHPKKNLVSLVDAFSQARKSSARGSSWHLCIAGWEQIGYAAELNKRICEHDLSTHIHLIGSQYGPDKLATLRHADGFVLPSFSEGLPMAVLEAWAAGQPVIMTAECNLSEGFSSGAAIRIGHSSDEIIPGLLRIFEMDEDSRRLMGRKGQELVKLKFSWPRVAANMEKVYHWMLTGSDKPDFVEMWDKKS